MPVAEFARIQIAVRAIHRNSCRLFSLKQGSYYGLMAGSPVATMLTDVLARFPQAGGAQITFPPPGYSSAIVARVRGTTGDFALRGWPTDSLPPERICGLHRLLGHVHSRGVECVAVPVPCQTGETLTHLRGRHWQLEPWLTGTADYWSNPHEQRLRAAMRRLAEWHTAAASFVAAESESAWFYIDSSAQSPAVMERLAKIQQLQQGGLRKLHAACGTSGSSELGELAQRILQRVPRGIPAVAADLQLAARSRYSLQPCLRDIWHDHVLFAGHEVTGLIDPSAARIENVATDLARLLGSLVEDDHTLWGVALEEYRQHRPLSTNELALIEILDRSTVLLAGITWLQRFADSAGPIQDDERIITRLRVIVARLEKLVQS